MSRASVDQNAPVTPHTQIATTSTTDLILPASLDIAAFRVDVQLSWLLQHYLHRPVLRDVISLSARNSLGEAAMAATKVMAATLFAKFHKLLPIEATSPSQTAYGKEYGYAIQALRTQVSSFHSDRLEAVLVPALLLFISEVHAGSHLLQTATDE